MPKHNVRPGESMPSIAKKYGFLWESLWEHPDNDSLRQQRPSPFQLVAGDTVSIPKKELREETLGPGRTHRFVKKGQKVPLRLKLGFMEEPRADEAFVLVVDDKEFEGVTDGDGMLEVMIPCDARQGKLLLDDGREVLKIRLGHLDPITELTGVQQRLRNLNFRCGRPDGQLNDKTRRALRRFQSVHGLEPTGEPDEATRQRLQEEHP